MAKNQRNHLVGAIVLFALAGDLSAQSGCYHDGVRLDGTVDGNGQVKCLYPPGQPGSNSNVPTALERERANLRQREAELQRQVERDRAMQQQRQLEQARQQQRQAEQARQQQERRDRNTQQRQQLQGVLQQEMNRQQQGQPLPRFSGDSEAEMRNDAAALRDALGSMDTQGAAASAAAALDALQQEAKDPSLDYAGQACSYFTRPMERPDGSGLNVYADGSTVCYGGKMYQCMNRRWHNWGRCDLYARSELQRAELLEGGATGSTPFTLTPAVKGTNQQSDFNGLREQIRNAKTEEQLREAGASLQAYSHYWGNAQPKPTDFSGALDTAKTALEIAEVIPGPPMLVDIAISVATPTPTVTDEQVREQRMRQAFDEFLRQVEAVRNAPPR